MAHMPAPPRLGPCCWSIPDPTCCPKWETASPEDRDRAKSWASFLLWIATGRQLGQCVTRLRPCRKRCEGNDWPPRCSGQMATAGNWAASVVDPAGGAWAGVSCGCGGDACSCTTVCAVDLPGVLPEPLRVDVDGWEIPLDTFRVDNGRWLVWQQPCAMPCECEPTCCRDDPCGLDLCGVTDPCNCDPPILDCFPACQDLSKPAGCKGTWEITYRHGIAVPEEGLWAGSELACEVLKSCEPGECRLPSNITSITRANVSMEFANNGAVTTANGRTLRFGIPIVDMWVQAMNPYGHTGPAVVWSPDINPGRVQTWPY